MNYISYLRYFFIGCFILYLPVLIIVIGMWIRKIFKFEINNDLNNINPSFHNIMHTIITFTMSIIFTPIIAYLIMLFYEFSDGLKPWDSEFKECNKYSKLINKLINMWYFSNKFSLQDVFVWNMSGFILGCIIYYGFM